MLIILGSAHGVYAQSMDSFREQTDITPSVETWKMTRHGGLSPSLYTGAMQWSLPLYVYKDYDFELPVSLAYSYDGFRPGESSGSVGLGWTLNVGGVITREVRGLRDECLKQVENGTYLYGYYYAWKKSLGTSGAPKEFLRKELLYFNMTPEDMSFIELLRDDLPNDIIVSRPTAYNEKYETEPDIFRFNFCGHSGEFRFGENGRIDIFCTDEPECDFKIEVGEMTGPDCETFNFKITTSDGYIYSFGTSQNSWEYSEGSCYFTDDPKGTKLANTYGDQTVTAWKLASIKSPSGREVVFEYDTKSDTEVSTIESYTPSVERLDMTSDNQDDIKTPSYREKRYNLCHTRLLKSILLKEDNTAQTLMKFEWKQRTSAQDEHTSANYKDAGAILPNIHNNYRNRLLSKVVVQNGNGTIVENIVLNHGFLNASRTGANRVMLSSVETKTQGKWAFDYKGVSSGKSLPEFNDYSEVDIYGYWGGCGLSDLRGRENYDDGGLRHQRLCENTSFEKASTGALTRIHYPTGGRSEIEYENNKVNSLLERTYGEGPHLESFISEVSGVRVKRITDWNAGKIAGEKEYEYRNGVLWRYPRVAFQCDYKKSILDPRSQIRSLVRLRSTFYARTGFGTTGYGQKLGYGVVIEKHRDESFTYHEYYGWEDYPDDYYPESISSFLSDLEPLNETMQSQILNMFMHSSQDRSAFRGREKTIAEYDAAGTEWYRQELTYIPDTPIIINENANLFAISGSISRTIFKPVLRTKTESSHGLLKVCTEWSLDGNGRVGSEVVSDLQSGWSKNTEYSYCNGQSGNDMSACPGAVRKIYISVRENSDSDYIVTDLVQFNYKRSDKSAKPSAMWVYRMDVPKKDRVLERDFDALDIYDISRDSHLRPLRVDMSGGAFIEYTWDSYGRNIVSRTVNGEENKTLYTWQDMIGLSSVNYPSGLAESYLYDSHNRLSIIKNSDGKIVSKLTGRLSSELDGKTSRIIVDKYLNENGSRSTRDIEYYDALGRKAYKVTMGSGSEIPTIIQPIYYDYMDRADSAAYLPFTVNNINLSDFDSFNGYDWKTAQAQWYQKEYGDGTYPFTWRVYEQWKNGKVLQEWKPGTNYRKAGKKIQYDHFFNFPGEAIKRFSFTMSSPDSASVHCIGEWKQMSLERLEQITEENDTSIVFKDALGRVLLSRSINNGINHDTYYIRDLRDSVVLVIQPEGSSKINAGDTFSFDGDFVKDYCFSRLYDGSGKLLYDHTPGDRGSHYAYDRRGRLVYSDNALLRAQGKGRYYVYDKYDRIIEEGLGEPLVNIDEIRSGLVSQVPIKQMITSTQDTRRMTYWSSSSASGGLPSDMSFEAVDGVVLSSDISQARCLGSVSYDVLREISNNLGGYTHRAYWYNDKGRLVQMLEKTFDGWTSRYSWKYDFVGNELAYSECHEGPSGDAHKLLIKSSYDDRGRIISSERTLDGEALKSVDYVYDKLGRLQSKCGKENNASFCLQESTERNMLGWVTKVKMENSSEILFENSLSYRYDGLVNEASFNHNIPGTYEQKRTRNEYDYDHLGRFIGNRRYVNGIQTDMGTEKDIMYDLNGNLEFVRRNVDGVTNEHCFVYKGNTPELGYINPNEEMLEFGFTSDENGNLTQNGHDGVRISYNFLNLPYMADELTYKYLSDGTKLSVKKSDGASIIYRGSFVYDVSADGIVTLESVGIPEGRVYCIDTPDGELWECWDVKDYLGNVRAVVRSNNGSTIKINDYLPYGTKIEEYSTSYQVGHNRWHYAGKEYQDFGGSDNVKLIDFGSRYYSPGLGRWTATDPQSWKYSSASPYNYCNNNPVNFVDPNGEAWYETFKITFGDDYSIQYSISYEWTDANSQKELDEQGIFGRYLGEAVIIFNGYNDEHLDKDGFIDTPMAKAAEVTIYGINGPDDIATYKGLSVSSNPDIYPMILEGDYLLYQQQMSSSIYGTNSINYRISTLSGSLNIPPVGGYNKATGLQYITDVFFHRTNWNGKASSSSKGCLVINGKDWEKVEKQLGYSQHIYLRLTRQ